MKDSKISINLNNILKEHLIIISDEYCKGCSYYSDYPPECYYLYDNNSLLTLDCVKHKKKD